LIFFGAVIQQAGGSPIFFLIPLYIVKMELHITLALSQGNVLNPVNIRPILCPDDETATLFCIF